MTRVFWRSSDLSMRPRKLSYRQSCLGSKNCGMSYRQSFRSAKSSTKASKRRRSYSLSCLQRNKTSWRCRPTWLPRLKLASSKFALQQQKLMKGSNLWKIRRSRSFIELKPCTQPTRKNSSIAIWNTKVTSESSFEHDLSCQMTSRRMLALASLSTSLRAA